MATSKVIYQGELRTKAIHLQSGIEITTDPPLDNNGKGEAFSPTDLLATSLANCMITIMGMAANSHGIDLGGLEADITKIMAANPRRVAEIHISFNFPNQLNYSDKEKKILEHAALTCPVYYSLHPDIKKEISFNW
jgi:putative redox protein